MEVKTLRIYYVLDHNILNTLRSPVNVNITLIINPRHAADPSVKSVPGFVLGWT